MRLDRLALLLTLAFALTLGFAIAARAQSPSEAPRSSGVPSRLRSLEPRSIAPPAVGSGTPRDGSRPSAHPLRGDAADSRGRCRSPTWLTARASWWWRRTAAQTGRPYGGRTCGRSQRRPCRSARGSCRSLHAPRRRPAHRPLAAPDGGESVLRAVHVDHVAADPGGRARAAGVAIDPVRPAGR
jgi:hypothetical protein